MRPESKGSHEQGSTKVGTMGTAGTWQQHPKIWQDAS